MALNLEAIIARASRETGVPAGLIRAVIQVESGGNPNAVSPAGAIGLMQLMPSTARALGVNPWDPVQNVLGGARYLRQQYDRFGSWELALAAYNAGPGAVQKYGGVPPYKETQAYVRKVMSLWRNSPDATAGSAQVSRTPPAGKQTPGASPIDDRMRFYVQTLRYLRRRLQEGLQKRSQRLYENTAENRYISPRPGMAYMTVGTAPGWGAGDNRLKTQALLQTMVGPPAAPGGPYIFPGLRNQADEILARYYTSLFGEEAEPDYLEVPLPPYPGVP